jgi:hypothetical protein
MSTHDTDSSAPKPLGILGQPRQIVLILLGMILVTAASFLIVRTFNKPADVADKVVSDRLTKLAARREADAKQLGGYAWIDKNAGSVQLPIDRAMELTLDELKAKPVRKTEAAPTPPAPAAGAPAQ